MASRSSDKQFLLTPPQEIDDRNELMEVNQSQKSEQSEDLIGQLVETHIEPKSEASVEPDIQDGDAHTECSSIVQKIQETLSIVPWDHPECSIQLQEATENIGLSVHRFQTSREATSDKTIPRAVQPLEAEADLDLSIESFEEALRSTESDRLEWATRLQNLGLKFKERYLRKGTEANLHLAIRHFEDSLRFTPDNHSDKARRLQYLGSRYRDRFFQTKDLSDLDLAIQCIQEAVASTPKEYPELVVNRLERLGAYFKDKHIIFSPPVASFNSAIEHFQMNLQKIPETHFDRAGPVNSLGALYKARYYKTGTEADLDSAIQLFQEAVELTPASHPQRINRLWQLSQGYTLRYDIKGTETDFDLANQPFKDETERSAGENRSYFLNNHLQGPRIAKHSEKQRMERVSTIQRAEGMVMSTPECDPERARRVYSLGLEYYRTSDFSGVALQYFREALSLTTPEDPETANIRWMLGRCHLKKHYESQRDSEIDADAELDLAIEHSGVSLELIANLHPKRPGRLHALGKLYEMRYNRKGLLADIGLAIKLCQEHLLDIPTDHPQRAERLNILGMRYLERWKKNSAGHDLDSAIETFQETVSLTPRHDQRKGIYLCTAAASYLARYERRGKGVDLDACIEMSEESTVCLSPHDIKLLALPVLGVAYFSRFLQDKRESDLDLAITKTRDVLNPRLATDQTDVLQRLGRYYRVKHSHTQTQGDLEYAIYYSHWAFCSASLAYQESIRIGLLPTRSGSEDLPINEGPRNRKERLLDTTMEQFQEDLGILLQKGHPSISRWLNSLGTGFHERYLRIGAESDLESSLQNYQEAISLSPDHDPEQWLYLHNLGQGYIEKYYRTGDEVHLDLAFQQFKASLNVTTDGPKNSTQFYGLGLAYATRYDSTNVEADLDLAIQNFRESQKSLTDGDVLRPRISVCLGNGYKDRYTRNDKETDMNSAMEYFQEALALEPDYHLRAHCLESIGMVYRQSYLQKGEETDIDYSIEKCQEAVDLTPKRDIRRSHRLHSLGKGYHTRAVNRGIIRDINSAINVFQEAITLPGARGSPKSALLTSIGVAYMNRYRRVGADLDLDLGLRYLEEALQFRLGDHRMLAHQLQSLGIALQDRFRAKGNQSDLDSAITRFQEALQLPTFNDRDIGERLRCLGQGYLARHIATGAEVDLILAIEQLRRSFQKIPDSGPLQATNQYNLGQAYHLRYIQKGSASDLSLAIQNLQESLDHEASRVPHRIISGKYVARLHADSGNWNKAYQAISTTICLASQLASGSLELPDKKNSLAGISGLAAEAAALASMAEQPPYEVIRMLELGRGIIMASVSGRTAELYDLQEKHGDLATKYIRLRDQLNTQISPQSLIDPTGASASRHKVNQSFEATHELRKLIEEIRGIPGYEQFLLAPTEGQMTAAAASGPIVVINVSEYRCDALIVEKHGIRALRLPDLHAHDVHAYSTTLLQPDALGTHILEWLWDSAAKPVLDSLGFTQTPSDDWPRMWWVPTGILKKFPLHAAGYHTTSNTVLDRVISSYSTSIRTLMKCQEERNRQEVTLKSGRIVLLGMDRTPGYSDLQHATQEIDELSRLCSSMQLDVLKPRAYQKDILSAMNNCDIFHFAGHGLTNKTDPLQSSLLVRDGPLTVTSLLGTDLHSRGPFLAYLSACGTGRVKDDEFIDEELHLISAFQLAGFRHVVGTLWEVNDKSCVDIATSTYEHIKRFGKSDKSVATGLHNATRRLRSEWISESETRAAYRTRKAQVEPNSNWIERSEGGSAETGQRTAELYEEPPLRWVPYVHFGV